MFEVKSLLRRRKVGRPQGRKGLLHDFLGADCGRAQVSSVDLAAPVGEPAGLITSTSAEGEGLIHRDVTLVAIGEGKSHGVPERSMLVDPEFILAEHLMGHGSEAPFAS